MLSKKNKIDKKIKLKDKKIEKLKKSIFKGGAVNENFFNFLESKNSPSHQSKENNKSKLHSEISKRFNNQQPNTVEENKSNLQMSTLVTIPSLQNIDNIKITDKQKIINMITVLTKRAESMYSLNLNKQKNFDEYMALYQNIKILVEKIKDIVINRHNEDGNTLFRKRFELNSHYDMMKEKLHNSLAPSENLRKAHETMAESRNITHEELSEIEMVNVFRQYNISEENKELITNFYNINKVEIENVYTKLTAKFKNNNTALLYLSILYTMLENKMSIENFDVEKLKEDLNNIDQILVCGLSNKMKGSLKGLYLINSSNLFGMNSQNEGLFNNTSSSDKKTQNVVFKKNLFPRIDFNDDFGNISYEILNKENVNNIVINPGEYKTNDTQHDKQYENVLLCFRFNDEDKQYIYKIMNNNNIILTKEDIQYNLYESSIINSDGRNININIDNSKNIEKFVLYIYGLYHINL